MLKTGACLIEVATNTGATVHNIRFQCRNMHIFFFTHQIHPLSISLDSAVFLDNVLSKVFFFQKLFFVSHDLCLEARKAIFKVSDHGPKLKNFFMLCLNLAEHKIYEQFKFHAQLN